ncbi:hypothetical protein [Rubritalea tangerina]|uniref:hypothetical protein n=1 Tax=Rubritalea tangerina TaxID=430798 RepID=UPI00360C2C11
MLARFAVGVLYVLLEISHCRVLNQITQCRRDSIELGALFEIEELSIIVQRLCTRNSRDSPS